MDFFTCIADPLGKQHFHLGVDVFHFGCNGKTTGFNFPVNSLEFFLNQLQVISIHQTNAFQHYSVGQRAEHVKCSHLQVEFTVFSHGEIFNELINGY